MEHLLGLLLEGLYALVRRLDQRTQKPLDQVIPDLAELLARPEQVLTRETITIGPAKRYASETVYFFLTAVGSCLVAGLLLLLLHQIRPAGSWTELALRVAVLSCIPGGSLLFLRRWIRGSRCELHLQGVALRWHSQVVFCPWALFDSAGAPFSTDPHRTLVPVAAAAIPFVIAMTKERITAQGAKVRSPLFRFRPGRQVELQAAYEVNIHELARLLLLLGRCLGHASGFLPAIPEANVPADEGGPAPLEKRDRKGWITVPLTRLVYPPGCCRCNDLATTTLKVTTSAPNSRSGPLGLSFPVCEACRREYVRRAGKIRVICACAGLTAGLAAGVVIALLTTIEAGFWIGLIASFAGVLFGGLIGKDVGRALARPVQLKNYHPSHGTIMLRFHRTEYADQMLEAIAHQEEQGRPVVSAENKP